MSHYVLQNLTSVQFTSQCYASVNLGSKWYRNACVLVTVAVPLVVVMSVGVQSPKVTDKLLMNGCGYSILLHDMSEMMLTQS